jgi:hypothetical protein
MSALAALSLALTTAAAAEVRTTNAPVSPSGGIVCRIASGAAASRRVRVEGIDAAGTVTFDSGWFGLSPSAVFQSGIGPGRVCRFSIAAGSKEEIRTEALAFDAERQRFVRLPARAATHRGAGTTAPDRGRGH